MSDRQRLDEVDFHVLEKFRNAIPCIDTRKELPALKANVLRDGRFLDPVKVWDSGDGIYLVDGHNRLDVLEAIENEGGDVEAPFVEFVEFADDDAVVTWIRRNAVGQRNLPTPVRDRIIAEEYEKRKKSHGGDRRSKGQSDPLKTQPATTAEDVGRDFGVSEKTVKRAVKKEREAKKAETAGDQQQAEAIREGKVKQYNDSFDTAELDEEIVESSIVRDGAKRPVPETMREQQALASEINSAATLLDKLTKSIRDLHEQPGGEFLPVSQITEQVKALKGLIRHARYYTDCPMCRGKIKPSCRRCNGHGYIPFARRGQLSQDEQDWLEATA